MASYVSSSLFPDLKKNITSIYVNDKFDGTFLSKLRNNVVFSSIKRDVFLIHPH